MSSITGIKSINNNSITQTNILKTIKTQINDIMTGVQPYALTLNLTPVI